MLKSTLVRVVAIAAIGPLSALRMTLGEEPTTKDSISLPANSPAHDHEYVPERPEGTPPDLSPSPTPRPTSPPTRVTRGGFTSVQVNVNANGDNVIGDAANEPSMAIDPTNPSRIAIGWRQFDTVTNSFRQGGYGFSTNAGQSWTFPGVIEPGGVFASDPVLGFDVNGTFYYHSLQPDRGPGDWACYLYTSTDGGATWPGENYAFGGDKQWMTIDRTNGVGQGNIYVAWNVQFTCCPGGSFTRSINGGLSFMTPIAMPNNPYWGTLAVHPNGAVYVVGIMNGPSRVGIVRSSNAQNPLATPTFDLVSTVNLDGIPAFSAGPNPAGLLGQINIACDHSGGPLDGNVYVLSSIDRVSINDPLDVMFSRSEDGGVTWSPAVRINDDPVGNNAWQWFGTMSVAPTGRIDVVWNDTRNFPGMVNMSELFYSYSTDGGLTWSQNEPLTPSFNSHVGWPMQNKMGDYYDMISDPLAANLAYAATFNGEQDVYFARVSHPDCNGNNIADVDDIASGFSEDENANGIPDECDAAIPAMSTWGILAACAVIGVSGMIVSRRKHWNRCSAYF